jgi:MFS family permease
MAVGLARGLQYFGMFLSPILGATLIEHRRRVLPIGFAVGAAMRLQVLGIALAGILLPDHLALIAVCGLLGLFGFFMGMQGVVFSYLMSKVIPVERRGSLMGLRNALSGLTASVVAYVGGSYLVAGDVLGNGYAATFGLAFLLTSVGLCMLLFVKEPQPPIVREPSRLADRLRELPSLLASDRAFTVYFLSRALATMGRMAVPFYFLYVQRKLSMSVGEALGILTLAFTLANTTTNLLWGWMADRTGFRLVFLASIALWILSAILLMQASELVLVIVSFSGVGMGLGGFMLSAQNMVLEFGDREDLPMRIAVANSASELVGAIGPVVGGVLAYLWSYHAVFWAAIAFQLIAVGCTLIFVEDPRRTRRMRLED